MCAGIGFQCTGDGTVKCPGERTGQKGERRVQESGQSVNHEANHSRNQGAEEQLSLCADIEKPGFESKSDC